MLKLFVVGGGVRGAGEGRKAKKGVGYRSGECELLASEIRYWWSTRFHRIYWAVAPSGAYIGKVSSRQQAEVSRKADTERAENYENAHLAPLSCVE